MASTWGTNSWGDNSWQSNILTETLTGVSASFSLGTIAAFPEQGWGRQQYGNSAWNAEYSVILEGLSASTSLGTVIGEEFVQADLTGVEATTSLGDITLDLTTFASLTGIELTASVGTILAQNEQGWGRDDWGVEPWGESFDPAPVLDGQQATASVGSLTPADVIGVTGLESTTSVGDVTMIGDVTVTLTGQSATASEGSLGSCRCNGSKWRKCNSFRRIIITC